MEYSCNNCIRKPGCMRAIRRDSTYRTSWDNAIARCVGWKATRDWLEEQNVANKDW